MGLTPWRSKQPSDLFLYSIYWPNNPVKIPILDHHRTGIKQPHASEVYF